MTKHLLVAASAIFLVMSPASAQSILQRSDWQERKLEAYLPPPGPAIPWLDLNTNTKLPKGELPVGRDVVSPGPFVLPSVGADTRQFSNADAASRSM